MHLTSGSLFAGIGGFDLGLEYAGITCKWQVEIDNACQGVLAKHWPGIPRYGDIHDVGKHNLEKVDIITGGFPCQDLSCAGKRKGLAGERSGLFFEYARVIREIRPLWIVVENVPGLFSSNKGEDFVVVLETLAECGYGVAWRVLDSQYFGVAQRRRRVFIVGSLGDGGCAKVLFEPESLSWDTAPCRETGQGIAAPIKANSPSRRGGGSWPIMDEFVYGFSSRQSWIAEQINLSPVINAGGGGFQAPAIAATLNSGGNDGGFRTEPGAHLIWNTENCYARHLTPTECERLQGFPDGWTAGQSDSARYKQLGNAVTVSVTEWIGRRIVDVERTRGKRRGGSSGRRYK